MGQLWRFRLQWGDMRSLLVCLLIISSTPRAHAFAPVFDGNVFYFTDSLVYDSATSAYNRTFFDFMLGIPLTKSGSFVVGWNYDSYSFIDNPETATTLKISGMGPKFVWALDKEKTCVVSFTYNLITKGTYTPAGGTASELRGSSMRAEFGYQPAIGENFFLGPKLNYYKATFTEEVTGETTLTKVTDSRTSIYPSLGFTYRFD